ncbi:MAG: hypothetical protein HRU30_00090 [Rhodobacteraceae bacterium]|nr:hypothetical protein [Paracoccaceae bacterium]
MLNSSSPYRFGAMFVTLSAVLHLISPIFGGFSQDALMLFAAGVVYAVIARGLMGDRRWLAYLTFLILMIGSVVALTYAWSLGPVPSWIYVGIIFADWGGVLALFVALWRKPVAVAQA